MALTASTASGLLSAPVARAVVLPDGSPATGAPLDSVITPRAG